MTPRWNDESDDWRAPSPALAWLGFGLLAAAVIAGWVFVVVGLG